MEWSSIGTHTTAAAVHNSIVQSTERRPTCKQNISLHARTDLATFEQKGRYAT
jgi:hypothetical protein